MYAHTFENAHELFTLHDCTISSVRFEGSDLALYFENGFRALPGTQSNPGEDLVRTGPSRLLLRDVLQEDGGASVQHSIPVLGRFGFSLLQRMTETDFFDLVNEHAFRAEIVSMHRDAIFFHLSGAIYEPRRRLFPRTGFDLTVPTKRGACAYSFDSLRPEHIR